MKYRALPAALLFAASGVTNAAPPPASSAPAAANAPTTASGNSFLHGEDVPNAATAAPSSLDWHDHAHFIAPTRGEAGPCKLSALREWVRLDCRNVQGAGLVAGDPKGVSIDVTEAVIRDEVEQSPIATTVIFPVRRGAALVFSFLALGVDYNSDSLVEGGTLSVVWRERKADPVLAMYGVPVIATPVQSFNPWE